MNIFKSTTYYLLLHSLEERNNLVKVNKIIVILVVPLQNESDYLDYHGVPISFVQRHVSKFNS